jgi:Rrf2 family iron-sulfur cluster assembly transcriptional regulator
MRLSTKSRYGLRALFDIAYNSGTLPAQIQDISRRQEISPRYLEQIFQSFNGGYYLSRPPEAITIKEIIQSAEGDIALVECVNGKVSKRKKGACLFDGSCVTQTIWQEGSDMLNEFFDSLTLKTLCERGQAMGVKREQDHRFVYFI